MAAPLIRAFQWDLARQVERLDVLLGLLPRYAEWGYSELYLHLEDAVEYPNLPGVARKDAYSYREFGKLVDAAQRVGIGVVPIVNLLGHTQYLIKVPEHRDLNELREADGSPRESGQICPLHPRTPDLARRLIGDMAPFCTAGKIHVGLDESFHLGKCPRCQEEIRRFGLAYHFSEYVKRLHALASPLDLRLGMWADMLNFIPEAIQSLPKGIIAYDWYYYPFRKHPRVELFNFAESDLAKPLRAQGVEYWGCPMNGAFRYEPLPLFKDRLANIRSWWRRCRTVGAGGMLITSWEAYRLAFEMPAVVDAAAASLWLDSSEKSDRSLLSGGFARVFGRKGAARSAAVALASDVYPFAGYARWELNDRWDVSPFTSPAELVRATEEVRFFSRLERTAARLSAPLAASVSFRCYLAKRDAFIRRAAKNVWRLRRMLAARPSRSRALIVEMTQAAERFQRDLLAGKKAARTMWCRTRDPRVQGQNEQILTRDAERLKAWRGWLRACAKAPIIARNSTPVCGAWQLSFVVVNATPALQRVLVEQETRKDAWRELHARYTIEFQALAASPRASLRRVFSVPLDDPERLLRIAIRGLGEVRIEDVVLSNGLQNRRRLGPSAFKLGRPAPRSGFPNISERLDELVLEFDDRPDTSPRLGRGRAQA